MNISTSLSEFLKDYTDLGFQNVAIGRINEVAVLTRWLY